MLGGLGTIFGLASAGAQVFGASQRQKQADAMARTQHQQEMLAAAGREHQAQRDAARMQTEAASVSRIAAGENEDAQRTIEEAAALEIPAGQLARYMKAAQNQSSGRTQQVLQTQGNAKHQLDTAKENRRLEYELARSNRAASRKANKYGFWKDLAQIGGKAFAPGSSVFTGMFGKG